MPPVTSDHKSDMNNRGSDLPIGESDHAPVLSPMRPFYSPSLGENMVSQDNFEFADSDLGMMNRSNSNVYSPVFSNFFFLDKQPADINKSYGSSYEVGKSDNLQSNTKLTLPMMMLPDSATRKQNSPFTQLLSQITDNSTYYAECMEQINHVSKCREMDGGCNFPFCLPLQRDFFHIQKCEDSNCPECQLLRPLIFLHSLQCKQDSCEITLCRKYREAWDGFLQKLPANTPIPNFELLYTTKFDAKPPVKQEKPVENSKKHSRSLKNQIITPEYHEPTLKDPNESVLVKSPQLPETDMVKPAASLTPLSSFILPGQSLSASTSPVAQILQANKTHVDSTKLATNTISVQYIVCCKCGKHRAVPSTLDTSLLPHFECSMNIWDDNKYNNCMIEENVDINYSINLSRKGPNYDQDCAHFVNKLKAFLATNQIMSYRPPTLGRKEVDLYRLFREVTAYGGCDSVVSKEGTWAKIYRGLDNFSPTETSASFRLKKMYTKYLLAYEKHIFNFLPIPAKKHRFPHTGTSASSPLPAGQQSSGIQNSAIFPPTSGVSLGDEANYKRLIKASFPSDTPVITNEGQTFNHQPIHQSVLLNNTTKYTPGAGIGLTGGSINWNTKSESSSTSRIHTRSTSLKRSANEISQGNTVISSTTPSSSINIHSDEILSKQIETENSHPMTTRSKSSRSSPIPTSMGSNPSTQTQQQQTKKEILSKSPILTGEDAEGAEGLKALMGLRSSLSPIVPILEEARWGALVNAATDPQNLEKLPGPAMK